jgi:hypothetical protein
MSLLRIPPRQEADELFRRGRRGSQGGSWGLRRLHAQRRQMQRLQVRVERFSCTRIPRFVIHASHFWRGARATR